MTTAFSLVAKALRGETPLRVVFFGLLNKLNFLLKTGNRRFEFERLYSEEFDPWRYHSSTYEQAKYRLTLDRILTLRRGSGLALEVGCSLGVFSGLLAEAFGRVVSVDISAEALRQAQAHNRGQSRLTFVRGEIQNLELDLRADVITCAEVLYYIREKEAGAVCESLERKLAADGIIVYVSGLHDGPSSEFYFNGWPEVLRSRFHELHHEVVSDPERPYELIVFERRA